MKKVIFFDFDGVIVDSSLVKHNAFLSTISTLGKSELKSLLDLALKTDLVGAERSKVADWVTKKTAGQISRELFLYTFSSQLEQVKDKITLTEGVLSFLPWIQSIKIQSYIVSAAPRHDIERVLGNFQLTSLFQDIFSSDAGSKEECLSNFFSHTYIQADECFFYGDMPSDFYAANKYHIPFIRIESHLGNLCNWPLTSFRTVKNFLLEKDYFLCNDFFDRGN